ncbi:MAG: entericidin A/B family lipoprotein [Candidatus Hydrogenedens sp.]|nr:entericidin A/B family lipoprotein [Candidatus Hydrogenedens sp.]
MLRKIVLAAVTITCALGLLAGCNTVKGVGKDIERGGQRLQDVSER